MSSKTSNTINSIYNSLTYNDLNGKYIIITIITLIVLLLLISYFYILANIKPIRKNWPEHRCNPLYMPFAGFIMRPKNQSQFSYTEKNYSYCLNQILEEVVNIALIPIKYSEKLILDLEKAIAEIIIEIIRLLNYLKAKIMELLNAIFNKLSNILIEVERNGFALKDIFNRNVGIFTIIFRVAETIWNTFGSALETFWNVVIDVFDDIFTVIDSGLIATAIALMTSLIGFFPGLAVGAAGVAAIVVTNLASLFIRWLGPAMGVEFDFSKALWFFTYNDDSKIDPILKDRMYCIETKAYTTKEKIVIANKHLIPKIIKEVNIDKDQIVFEDNIIEYIIQTYTNEEKGVRNLKRCIETIYTKLNLYRLLDTKTKLFDKELLDISFPLNLTTDIVQKLIEKKTTSSIITSMYM